MKQVAPMSVVMSSYSSFLESSVGEALLEVERAALAAHLEKLVGYNCLQLSVQRGAELCNEERFGQLVKMGYAPSADTSRRDSVWADYEELPVASDCVDVAVLHHVLEFAEQPHQLLREATRTLTAGGHLLIAGFNPYGLWPMYRRYYRWRSGHAVEAGRRGRRAGSIQRGRLADWLSLLNYELLDEKYLFFRPPINSETWLRRLEFCDRWGRYSRLPFGLAYVTLARKRTIAATPVSLGWRRRLGVTPAARAQGMGLQQPGSAARDAAAQRNRSLAGRMHLKRIK